jgi:uncharacterized damage-inducible protein DinB
MLLTTIQSLLHRDLTKLRYEIQAYKSEKNLWHIEKGIANSAGNLCLHLIGNLNTYIGATLGHTGYIRHREQEFLSKDIAKDELLSMIDDTIRMIATVLSALSESVLDQEYPLLVLQEKKSTEFFLVHLSGHLTYHLGQINYHRRLLDL